MIEIGYHASHERFAPSALLRRVIIEVFGRHVLPGLLTRMRGTIAG